MNDDEEGNAKDDPNEEEYPGLSDSPEVDAIINNRDEERIAKSYDKYIGAEVVIPDWKGNKQMIKVSKDIKYDDIST